MTAESRAEKTAKLERWAEGVLPEDGRVAFWFVLASPSAVRY